jgi:outer membrane immunogenic protein
MRKSLFALVALLSTGASAWAADLGPYRSLKDAPVVPLVPVFSWTGFYIGAQAGYEWGSADHSFRQLGLPIPGVPSGDSSPEGFIGGGHVGYNWQTGKFVLGIEADFEGGNVDGSFFAVHPVSTLTSTGKSSLNWQGSVRGRLGYAIDRTLFYFTGGWAFADFDFRGGELPPACCGYSETLNGWTVGGGVEHALTIMPNVSVRAEYRYTDFGSASGPLKPVDPGVQMPVDLTSHAVRLGASFHW